MTIFFDQLRDLVIQPTLAYLGHAEAAAINLLLGTVAQESQGRALAQWPTGPARGLWQIEPGTHDDVVSNFLAFRPEFRVRVDGLAYAGFDRHSQLTDNLKYGCAIARLVYYRAPQPLPAPDDLPGLAQYWKAHYNTAGGAGSVQEFINNYENLIGAPHA